MISSTLVLPTLFKTSAFPEIPDIYQVTLKLEWTYHLSLLHRREDLPDLSLINVFTYCPYHHFVLKEEAAQQLCMSFPPTVLYGNIEFAFNFFLPTHTHSIKIGQTILVPLKNQQADSPISQPTPHHRNITVIIAFQLLPHFHFHFHFHFLGENQNLSLFHSFGIIVHVFVEGSTASPFKETNAEILFTSIFLLHHFSLLVC